jgi:integrase
MEDRRPEHRMIQQLKIIQEQVGHEHASTTSIYTCVSSDFRTRTLRRHLDAAVAEALRGQGKRA